MTEQVVTATDHQRTSTRNRPDLLTWSLGVSAVGIAIICAGCFMLANAPSIASDFLGATVTLGGPMSAVDAVRIHAAAFVSSTVLVFGLLATAVGIVLAMRGRGICR